MLNLNVFVLLHDFVDIQNGTRCYILLRWSTKLVSYLTSFDVPMGH